VNGRLALLAESLLLGVLVFLAALPLVTAFVAVAAGCVLLREGIRVNPRTYLAALVAVGRAGPAGFAVPVVVGVVLLLDLAAVRAGVPGHRVLAAVLPILAAGLGVLALRAAAGWRPGAGWLTVIRTAGAAMPSDLYGTALLAGAAVVAVVVSQTFPIVTPLALGQVVLAAVAIETRSVTGKNVSIP
jgi:hypothetical protein